MVKLRGQVAPRGSASFGGPAEWSERMMMILETMFWSERPEYFDRGFFPVERPYLSRLVGIVACQK